MLDSDANPRSAQQLARPVGAVVVEAGAVGRVLLTREGAADGRGDARPPDPSGRGRPSPGGDQQGQRGAEAAYGRAADGLG